MDSLFCVFIFYAYLWVKYKLLVTALASVLLLYHELYRSETVYQIILSSISYVGHGVLS